MGSVDQRLMKLRSEYPNIWGSELARCGICKSSLTYHQKENILKCKNCEVFYQQGDYFPLQIRLVYPRQRKGNITILTGGILLGAGTHAICETDLERIAEIYLKSGKYPSRFWKRGSENYYIVGRFDKPVLGMLKVKKIPSPSKFSFFSKKPSNVIVSGESYGEGIVDVILDFLKVTKTLPVEPKKVDEFLIDLETSLLKKDDELLKTKLKRRKNYYKDSLRVINHESI